MSRFNPIALPLVGWLGLAAMTCVTAHAAPGCSVQSAATVTPVLELYTSEGCSSCPPADQWLSRLKPESPIVALAFHVDYWDRLGWKDRFASPAYTQRQAQQQLTSGARFSYTPQVLLDGADRPDWIALGANLASRPRPAASVDVQLSREGQRFTALIAGSPTAPARLAAYWAVTEQGHVSAVKAGENSGATLAHDHVVREYQPVAAWARKPATAPTTLLYSPTAATDPAHARQVNLVIVNADTGRPVQAVKLGC